MDIAQIAAARHTAKAKSHWTAFFNVFRLARRSGS